MNTTCGVSIDCTAAVADDDDSGNDVVDDDGDDDDEFTDAPSVCGTVCVDDDAVDTVASPSPYLLSLSLTSVAEAVWKPIAVPARRIASTVAAAAGDAA